MNEVDVSLIKKKSLSGIVALTKRTFILQVVGFVTMFLLGIFLNTADFGAFGVVSAFISFLAYFSDIGLAGALIQKKEEVTDEDLATTFTIQQLMVCSLVIGALIFSGPISRFYSLNTNGLWLFRSLLVSFFLSSLKTIPSVLLERRLDFNKLVVPQILETLAFNLVTLVLAWRGFGVASFTWGTLARGVVGLAAMYYVSPWRIRLGINRDVAKRLFRYGVPFQWNSILALLKDDLMFLFLGKILPLEQLGYIAWAKKWAEVPLRLVMDNVIRVTFPAFARLQHDAKVLGDTIEKALFGVALSIFPLYSGMLFFMLPFIHIVPRYGKWEPALLSFYLLGVTSVLASLSTPLTNALNAIGKIHITLALMVCWVVMTWVFALTFLNLFGYNGFALALLTVSFTIIAVVYIMRRTVAFSFWNSVKVPLLGVLLQSIFYALVIPLGPQALGWFIPVGLAGVILYGGTVWRFERQRIHPILSGFRGTNRV